MNTKICGRGTGHGKTVVVGCGKEKHISDFYTGYSTCKECRQEYMRNWKKGGMKPSEKCEVCGSTRSTRKSRHSSTEYDHNHKTGKFRGWLCSSCNSALGYAGDNPRLLEKLAVYLKQHGCAPTRPVIS